MVWFRCTGFRNAPFSEVATESRTINAATTDYLIFPKSGAKVLLFADIAKQSRSQIYLLTKNRLQAVRS